MPTTHNIRTWVIVTCVVLTFVVGIGIIILVIYIIFRLLQPATACSYCEGDTYPAPMPMPYSPMPLVYAPLPPYGYNPYPAPVGWQRVPGKRSCPYCYQPVPMENRYCPSCGRSV